MHSNESGKTNLLSYSLRLFGPSDTRFADEKEDPLATRTASPRERISALNLVAVLLYEAPFTVGLAGLQRSYREFRPTRFLASLRNFARDWRNGERRRTPNA